MNNTKTTRRVHPCPAFIGAQVQFWRKQKNITQKKLSTLSGIKYRHLQEIEAGRVDIKINTLGLLAMSLEITPHLLLKPVEENRMIMCESCRDLIE